jgi:hypothetical protein
MQDSGKHKIQGQGLSIPAAGDDGPGSETERFQAITDLRSNERVTGESGVPRHQRDHELRCQLNSLDEFS